MSDGLRPLRTISDDSELEPATLEHESVLREVVAVVLTAAGVAGLTLAGFLVSAAVGFAVLGALLLAIGVGVALT